MSKENGSIMFNYDQFGILNKIELFYEKLHKNQEVLRKFQNKIHVNKFSVSKLNNEESTILDVLITKKEVYNFYKT